MTPADPSTAFSPDDFLGLRASAPDVSVADAAHIAELHFDLVGDITALAGELDRNFRVRGKTRDAVLKLSGASNRLGAFRVEAAALDHIARRNPNLAVPRVYKAWTGDSCLPLPLPDGRTVWARMLSYLPGRPLESGDIPARVLRPLGRMLGELDVALRGFEHPAAREGRLIWDIREAPAARHLVRHIVHPDTRQQVTRALDEFTSKTLPSLSRLRSQAVHNDAHGSNIVVDPADPAKITGLLDFGDMRYGPVIFDAMVPMADIALSGMQPYESAEEILAGYAEVHPLDVDEIAALYGTIIARQALTLAVLGWRQVHDPAGSALISEFEAISRDGLDTMLSLGQVEATQRFARAAGQQKLTPARGPLTNEVNGSAGHIDQPAIGSGGLNGSALLPEPSSPSVTENVRSRRHRLLGAGLELSYDAPLHIVRGEDVWLIAADGRRYLDCYNNVPHVGHSHPSVADAVARQWHILNTNTRYLSEPILDYAERLIALMPAGSGLDRCLFVNNGSEANDIAWRMAKLVTGARGGIAIDNAYHGGTDAVAALSPYDQFRHRLEPHIRSLEAPDSYRGRFGANMPNLGAAYAADAERATRSLADAGFSTAAFIVDTGFISSGMLDAPAGYLTEVASIVRRAGGLVIADEVQFGFARSGDRFWGFDAHGLTPDFVTMGKPAGNGQPMGVVVTRAEILERFLTATSYFSTFGGNQVSAVAGLAVLDVIERQRLLENAKRLGAQIKERLGRLQMRHTAIGDVRGQGLKLGVEIVSNRALKTPDRATAKRIANAVRQNGCLIGTEGPDGNVLKIRPPMTFTTAHADILIAALDDAFSLPA